MFEQNYIMRLLFYSYLNDKDDHFLSEHDFSREEIKYGLKELTSRYGIEGIKIKRIDHERFDK